MACCHDLSTLGETAPFSRIIGWGWDDGLTDGLAQCGGCGRAFEFRLVAREADEDDRRVFSLVPLHDGRFDAVLDVLSAVLEPRWPVWIPRWTFANSEEQSAVETRLEQLELTRGSVEWLVIAADLSTRIITARRVAGASERQMVESLSAIGASFQEWERYVQQDGP